MVRNIQNKVGKPSKVNASTRSVVKTKKAVAPTKEITTKEVIKPKKIKSVAAVKKPAVKAVEKKETVSAVNKAAKSKTVAKKKVVNVKVKNVSKQDKRSKMSDKLTALKLEKNKDIDLFMSTDVEVSMPVASREEMIKDNRSKKFFSLEINEEEKKIVAWTGAIFFMILFVAIWAYNIKTVLNVTAENSSQNQAAIQSFDDMQSDLKKLRSGLNEARADASSGRDDLFRPATSGGQAIASGETINTSSTTQPVATTTATSTEVK